MSAQCPSKLIICYFQTYAVGIRPSSGRLDNLRLEEIGGSPENVFVAESGFEGLGELLQNQLSVEVCENRCGEEQ